MKIDVKPGKAVAFSFLWLLLSGATVFFLSVLFVNSNALSNPLSLLNITYSGWHRYLVAIPFLVFFFVCFSALLFTSVKDDEYGDARLANKKDAKNLIKCLEDKGIIWGIKWGQFIRTNESLSALLLAPPGTGKTAGIAIPTLLSCTRSMIVNDIKGELWNLTSKARSVFGDVGIFAPTLGTSLSLKFNPIGSRCCPKKYNDAFAHMDNIAEAIFPTVETQGAEKHFNSEAKQFFMFWSLLLRFRWKKGEVTDEVSLPLMYDEASEATQEVIAALLDEYEDELPTEVRKLGFAISEKEAKDYGMSQTSFLQGLRPFWSPALRAEFEGAGEIDHTLFRQKRPFTLYITIPPRDMDTMAPIVRILSLYLVNAFISEPVASIKQDVFFLMDELARLGKMPAIVNAPEVARGYRVSFLFIAQSEQQLQALYGGGNVDAVARFNDVCEYTIIYTQSWQPTAKKLSDGIGTWTARKATRSGRDTEVMGSTSVGKEARPLFNPQDILNLSKNEAIFVRTGAKSRPVLMKKAWWFLDPQMQALVGAYNDVVLGEEYADDDEISADYVPETSNNEVDHDEVNKPDDQPLESQDDDDPVILFDDEADQSNF